MLRTFASGGPFRERGITLVAMMVGMVISFSLTLGVYSSLSLFDTKRREMIGGDVSLESALGALSELQWGIKHAGTAVAQGPTAYCPTMNIYYNGFVIANGAPLAPVRITANAGNTDQITVAYSGSLLGAMQNRVVMPMANAAAPYTVNTSTGLTAGDLVIVSMPGTTDPCTLAEVTGLQSTPLGVNVLHAHGTSLWNPPSPSSTFANAPSYPAGATVMRAGRFNWLNYRVVDNRLETNNLITGEIEVIADNVVGLRAWYGTTDGSNRNIEQWIAATDSWADPTPAQLNAIRAIRVAVLVRNPQHQKPGAAGCEATTTSTLNAWPGGPSFNLALLGTLWGCHKYRVLTLVVPLRSFIYGTES
jgi:type IV pilus assembly protein PilW